MDQNVQTAISQYRRWVADNPSDRKASRDSFYDKYGVDPESVKGFGGPKAQTGEASKAARKRLADLQTDIAKSGYEQDMRNAWGKFAGEAAAAIPVAAASVATAGMPVILAAGLSAGAAAAGGAMREATKVASGSSEIPTTYKELGNTLKWDAIYGAAGEGMGRGLGFLTTKMVPGLITAAAARMQKGSELIKSALTRTGAELSNTVQAAGTHAVDLSVPMRKALNALLDIPKGVGKIGKEFAGFTPKGAALVDNLSEALHTAGGSVGSKQPLDALVRMRSGFNQAARDNAYNHYEQQALRTLAKESDEAVRSGLKSLGQDSERALELYERYNNIAKHEYEFETAHKVVSRFMGSLVGKAAAGAGVGFGAGYYRTHTISGAVESAAIGAAGGAVVQAAPWALQFMLNHPEGGKLLKKAVDFAVAGKDGPAQALAARAAVVSGFRERAKDYIAQTHNIGPTTRGQSLKAERPPDAQEPK